MGETENPKVVATHRVVIMIVGTDVVLAALAIALGLVSGKPSRYFGEGRFTTVLSCAQLLAVAFLSSRIFFARRFRASKMGFISAAWVWLLIAAGFAFLAADDAFEIHERLDRAIHSGLHMQETAWTDRLDDAIIAAYGLIGVTVLWLFRTELLVFAQMWRPLAAGFVCLMASVICDAVSNREDLLVWIYGDVAIAKRLNTWVSAGDGALTLVAEGFFLAAFYIAHCATRESPLHVRQPI